MNDDQNDPKDQALVDISIAKQRFDDVLRDPISNPDFIEDLVEAMSDLGEAVEKVEETYGVDLNV